MFSIEYNEINKLVNYLIINVPRPDGSTHTSLHSSCVLKRLLFPLHPPYQNLEQPPYSVSKNHLTVKSEQLPRSFGSLHLSKSCTINLII